MRSWRALAALLVGPGCRDTTEPKRLHLAPIGGIEMATTVSVTDTLSIAFEYFLGCDRLDRLEVSQSSSGISFAVWAIDDGYRCLQSFAPQVRRHVQVVLPPHPAQFTVRFRQHTRDSVVVVHATGLTFPNAR